LTETSLRGTYLYSNGAALGYYRYATLQNVALVLERQFSEGEELLREYIE